LSSFADSVRNAGQEKCLNAHRQRGGLLPFVASGLGMISTSSTIPAILEMESEKNRQKGRNQKCAEGLITP
jgi:hypothetical protein